MKRAKVQSQVSWPRRIWSRQISAWKPSPPYRWLATVLIPLAGVGLVVAGLIYLDGLLRNDLSHKPRFKGSWADIECEPPEGVTKDQFLAEVQKSASLPDALPLMDPTLPETLAEAFAKHPWVERVERVEILASHKVRVELRYRVPTLAIPQGDGTLVVDGHGILLPKNVSFKDLPLWRGAATLPLGLPGKDWGDKDVEAAARSLAMLHAHQDRLHIKKALAKGGEVILTTEGGSRILWGKAPGKDGGEASADSKVERLLQLCSPKGTLESEKGPREFDLRLKDHAVVKPIQAGS